MSSGKREPDNVIIISVSTGTRKNRTEHKNFFMKLHYFYSYKGFYIIMLLIGQDHLSDYAGMRQSLMMNVE